MFVNNHRIFMKVVIRAVQIELIKYSVEYHNRIDYLIIIILLLRQFIRRRNMSVKSLQGRRTTYATRIKLTKIKVQNTTVKTNES